MGWDIFRRLLLVGVLAAGFVSPALSAPVPARDSVPCRSQLELLQSGNKLTEEEADRFEAQCKCLEERSTEADRSCVEEDAG